MKIKVSIQGVKGAFHHLAARRFFGDGVEIVECSDFRNIINSVENGLSDYGVMAIENSLVGNILQNYALLKDSQVFVVGEVYLRIIHNLIALPGETLNSITEVHSHPMALAQCEDYLVGKKNYKLVPAGDTALCARQISENELKGIAAIGSVEAALEYGLVIIDHSIETNKSNFTRFFILSKRANKIDAPCLNKASVVFSLPHKPGSLQRALQILSIHTINLTMLQSMPQVGQCWEYFFHADLVFGQVEDFIRARDFLMEHTSYFKTIGIYKAGSSERYV